MFKCRLEVTSTNQHSVKMIQIRSFSGPHFPAFGLNTGKYGPEKLRILTLFIQWRLIQYGYERHLISNKIMRDLTIY